ncbi:NAD(P)-dependent oxidoreductase, partial [Enterococcus faecalis]
PATGHYVVAGEVLTSNSQGDSYISYADYAVAMLDEVESKAHPNQRISVYL